MGSTRGVAIAESRARPRAARATRLPLPPRQTVVLRRTAARMANGEAARASKRKVSRSSLAMKVRAPDVSHPEDSPGLLRGVNRRHARAADMPHAIIEVNESFERRILH